MKTDSNVLDVIKLGEIAPIDVARAFYQEHSGGIDFYDDLADYLRTGLVAARPTCFAMAKLIWIEPRPGAPKERAWFVRFAVGRLRELLTLLPCELDWITFCRRGKEKMHIWPMKRLVNLAYKGGAQ
jgi:hypothetical protein